MARVWNILDKNEVVFDEGRFINSVSMCPDVGEFLANRLIENAKASRQKEVVAEFNKFAYSRMRKALDSAPQYAHAMREADDWDPFGDLADNDSESSSSGKSGDGDAVEDRHSEGS